MSIYIYISGNFENKKKKKNGPQSGSAITKSSGGILGFLFLFFLSHADSKDVNNAKKCFKF